MRLIREIEKKIEEIDKEKRELAAEISFLEIKNIQFTYHPHVNHISVSDTTLSAHNLPHHEQFKKLFIIKDYEIQEKTEHLEAIPNKDEVLEAAQNWCDKWKKKELENV